MTDGAFLIWFSQLLKDVKYRIKTVQIFLRSKIKCYLCIVIKKRTRK